VKLTAPITSNQSVGVTDLIGLLIPNQASSFATAMQATELTQGAPAEHTLPMTKHEPTVGSSEHSDRPRVSRKVQQQAGSGRQTGTVSAQTLTTVALPVPLARVHMPTESVAADHTQSTPAKAEVIGSRAQPAQLDVNGSNASHFEKTQNVPEVRSADLPRADQRSVDSLSPAEVVAPNGGPAEEHLSQNVQEAAPSLRVSETRPDASSLQESAGGTVVPSADPTRTPAVTQISVAVSGPAVPLINSSPQIEVDPAIEAKANAKTVPESRGAAIDQQKKMTAEPPQNSQNTAVSGPAASPAGARSDQRQSDESEPHRTSFGAVVKPGTAQFVTRGEAGAAAGTSVNSTPIQVAQGKAAIVPPSHSTAAPPASSIPQPREAMQQPLEASTARALGSAMRAGSLGIQTELFGRVTIQSSAGAGQLSAQLFLEDAKHGAILATHLPALEQRIGERYGVNASVQLASGQTTAGSAGGDGGSRQNQRQNQTAPSPARPLRFAAAAPGPDSSGLQAVTIGNMQAVISSRLDVTA
jgi:hypothetical protein